MSLYDFNVKDCDLNSITLSQYSGKVLIIVNTASLCGFTPQYRQLQQLYEKYHDQGLEILAFPCNQFAKEDPLPAAEIARGVRAHFGVEFPIMDKVEVNGDKASELYEFLKRERPRKLGFRGVLWNFEKFLVDREGRVVERYLSQNTPMEMERLIQLLLGSTEGRIK